MKRLAQFLSGEPTNVLDNNIKIGVIGTGHGVGTTEIAVSLSIWMSERYFFSFGNPQINFFEVSFSESSNDHFFNRYGLNRFLDRHTFKDIFTEVLMSDMYNPSLSTKHWLWDFSKTNSWLGVNWIVPGDNFPYLSNSVQMPSSLPLSSEKFIRIWESLKSISANPVSIYDLGRGLGKGEILSEMDLVVGIASPKKSCLKYCINDIHAINTFRETKGNLIWIVNGASDGIDKKYVRNILSGGQIIYMPKIDYERVLRCDSHMKFLFEDDFIKESLWKIFDRMSSFFEKAI